MPVKKKEAGATLIVAPVDDMDIATLIRHTEHPVTGRHRQTMRFITKGEHEADHRIHASLLDHVHRNHVEDPKEEIE